MSEESTPSLYELLPEQYHKPLQDAGIKDAESLAKNWADAQSALGGSLRIPGVDAAPEAWQAFEAKLSERVPDLIRVPKDDDAEGRAKLFAALGKPEAPDKYQFSAIEGLDEGTGRQITDWLAKVSHEADLTNDQARRIHAAIAESTRDNTQAFQASIEDRNNKLKAEWGQSYEQRVAMAENVIKRFAGEDGAQFVAEELSQSGLIKNPTLLKTLAKIAEGMSEDTLVVNPDRSRLPSSTADLQMQIAEAQANPAYFDKNSPMHKALVEKVERLYTELAASRTAA